MIFDWITSVPKDKLLHLLAGILVSLLAMFISGIFIDHVYAIKAIGLGSSILIGLAREVQNKIQGSLFDLKDWLYTIIGGLIASLLSIIVL